MFLTDYCTWDGQSFRSSTRHQIGTKFCKVMLELVEKTCDVSKNLSSLEAQLFVFSFLNMDQELLLQNTIGTFNAELTKSQNLRFFPRRNDVSKEFSCVASSISELDLGKNPQKYFDGRCLKSRRPGRSSGFQVKIFFHKFATISRCQVFF